MESQVGYERFFEPDDIFFSTTDDKGVILRTNRTFDSLSRYSRDRLIKSPHNIIRHLDMPAGVFRLMWNDLQAGLPVCAYVVNRAADGLDYRVFATIVPISGGYLSVRTKPLDAATQQATEQVYRSVRAKEREVAARGASRRQIGEYGAGELARELGAIGIESLQAMTLEQLPREISALVSAGVRVPAPPPVAGPVTQILTVVGQIERDTNLLVFELEEYLRLLTSMADTEDVLLDVANRTEAFGRVVGGRALNTVDRADALASQVFVFYSMFFFSLGVALLGSAAWRPEHRGSSWNAMRTTTHSPQALAAAKTLVITAPVVLMQVMVLALTWLVGAALGLGSVPPTSFAVECLIAVPAAQPLIAVQSLLSMRMRSFAAPVAVCFGGIVVGVALVLKGGALANAWPQSLVTRALTLGSQTLGTVGALDASGLVALLAGTAVCGAMCWGLLVLVARRRGGAL